MYIFNKMDSQSISSGNTARSNIAQIPRLEVLFALALIVVFITACTAASTPPSAAELAPTITLLPPAEQQGGSLAVRLHDAEGRPITDAAVRIEGDMNHAGMIPVISDAVSHESDGIYRVPFEFTMLGDWILSVYVTTAEDMEYREQIEVGVRQDGMVLDE